jgi:hypothetical protein
MQPGHNNCNLAGTVTTVTGNEWELFEKDSSHYCFQSIPDGLIPSHRLQYVAIKSG